MKEWLKEHGVETVVCVFTILGYLGISTSDLLGIAQYANYIMPFVYLGVGIFIGRRIHSRKSKRRFVNLHSRISAAEEKPLTENELIDSFAHAPFEIKVFLKAALDHDAVYRNAQDYAWEYYEDALDPFIQCTNIRNDICRCVVRDEARSQFESIPSLLSDVQEKDIEPYAVRGTEGIKPQVFSTHKLIWWYYTDDENIPEPFDLIGFMRQPPVS